MSKHTPGPWAIDRRSMDDVRVASETERGSTICEMGRWAFEFRSERDANARLIAAAPDLLEALEALHAVVLGECPSLLNEDSGGDATLAMKIEAAIAKARGEA